MPLFANLEKLINEHGSAAILRERLLLAEDKYAALEEKVARLQEENSALKQENERLRKAPVVSATDSPRLDEDQERVLGVFANHNRWISTARVSHALSMSEMKAQYCIDTLLELEMLQHPGIVFGDSEITYHIHHKGRAYALKHGLAK